MGIFDGVLLVTDVDGTLLNSRNELTPRVLTALERFCAGGGLFTVATGRSFAGFDILCRLLPLSAPAILSNGGYIYDYSAKREVYTRWLSGTYREVLRDILSHFPGIGTELHWPDRVCIQNRNRWNDLHMEAVQCEFEEIENAAEYPGPWLKVLFVDAHDTLRRVQAYAEARYGNDFSFFFSASCLLEMQNAGIDKSDGVRRLEDVLSLNKKHIYTAGDAGNDLGMLREYESFAPASATEEARAAAKHIVPSCDEDALSAVVAFLAERYE